MFLFTNMDITVIISTWPPSYGEASNHYNIYWEIDKVVTKVIIINLTDSPRNAILRSQQGLWFSWTVSELRPCQRSETNRFVLIKLLLSQTLLILLMFETLTSLHNGSFKSSKISIFTNPT